MKCLLVTAHPLPSSLCHSLSKTALDALKAVGHDVTVEDLYAQAFPPALSAAERAGYYEASYDESAVQTQAQRLRDAEGLVLCFPTWWFGFPAILKGWFDRVWAPGVAYDHASDLGAIKPRLPQLKRVLVITSLGSAWWVDLFIMRKPIRRILKTAILGTCAPQAQFDMLSIYSSEKCAAEKVTVFQKKIKQRLAQW
jgi:putative NADPH-quinone reductase